MATERRHLALRRRTKLAATAATAVALIAGLSGCQVPFVGVANASTPTTTQPTAPPGQRGHGGVFGPMGSEHGQRQQRPGTTTGGNTTTPTNGATPPANPPAPNPNCSLVVPPAPLTAAGLATPYQLSATDRRAGDCHEANPNQSAFVEATILDPATGALSIYRPLVVDAGTPPAALPLPPTLPANAAVGVWFGFQGNTLTLRNAGSCVNGAPGSPFGEFGYCGAPAFFAAANAAVQAKKITVPSPGTALDGQPCPTTRDFSVVDQDQSDNLTTTYVALPDGRTEQSTPAATATRGATTLSNASDNGLLVSFVDPALGCHPFTAPDTTAGGAPSTSLALNELQAAAFQGAPVATVPPNDPMTLIGNRPSEAKTNLYRAGVNMAPLNPAVDTSAAYCSNLATIAPTRLALDKQWTNAVPSPDPAAAATLFGFLAQRLTASWTNLRCHGAPPVVAGAPATNTAMGTATSAPTTTAAPATTSAPTPPAPDAAATAASAAPATGVNGMPSTAAAPAPITAPTANSRTAPTNTGGGPTGPTNTGAGQAGNANATGGQTGPTNTRAGQAGNANATGGQTGHANARH
jgi:hypothetical protein